MPRIKNIHAFSVEIVCLQGFCYFVTSGDLMWPFISAQNSRSFPLKMINPYKKYEIPTIPTLRYGVYNIFPRIFKIYLSDLCWPLTWLFSDYNDSHDKYEKYPCFLPWDIVLTRFFGFWPLWPYVTSECHQRE